MSVLPFFLPGKEEDVAVRACGDQMESSPLAHSELCSRILYMGFGGLVLGGVHAAQKLRFVGLHV